MKSKRVVTPPPPSPYRNECDKPPLTASLFAQAAWWLADYAELWWVTGPYEGEKEIQECEERCTEMLTLSKRLKALDGEWAARCEASPIQNAANIVADLLKDGKLPGSVWYLPRKGRWRLGGEGYRPANGEILVGVYSSSVTVEQLIGDFEELEQQ